MTEAWESQDGYTQLAAEVLERGVRDLVDGRDDLALSAFAWVYGDPQADKGGFAFWCNVVGWDPEGMRKSIRRRHRARVDALAVRWGRLLAESPAPQWWECGDDALA